MGVFVSERRNLIGLVCVQRGWGRALGSPRSKVKYRHGSIELGIERAQGCCVRRWGLGNQYDEGLAPEKELCTLKRSDTLYFLPLSFSSVVFCFFFVFSNTHNVCVNLKGFWDSI